MTAPADDASPEIGVLEWFWLNDHERVEAAIEDLRQLGVRHLRTGLSWADYVTEDGPAWFDWLLPKLAAEFELLPCFVYTPPSHGEVPATNAPPRNPKDYADFLDTCIERYGQHFDTVELWNEPNNLRQWDYELDPSWRKFAAMIGGAAYWAHQRGKRTVLGGMSPIDPNWLHTMHRVGVLEHIDIVGVHGFPDSYDVKHRPWTSHLRRVREQLAHYGLAARVWITETGYPTWRHDEFRQLQEFANVLALPVERVYWYSLTDLSPERSSDAGFHTDQRDYHFGIKTAKGQDKLLARCWAERGLDGVRAMAKWPAAGAATTAPAPVRARPETQARPPVLVTGGAGFVGTNLTARLVAEGRQVRVLDNLSRPGVEKNLEWLRQRCGSAIEFIPGDMRNARVVDHAVDGCAQIFHLAAQVAVTTSLEDPRADFDVNLAGTLNLLEAARRQPRKPGLVFTSTNKVYGDLNDVTLESGPTRYQPRAPHIRQAGIDESRPLDFHSPYGCSKGGADQYVLDYGRCFGVPTVVFRMSCIYGPHQFGTEDQGWVAHFLIRARERQPITIYGDGKQVRDVLFVDDLVAAFLLAENQVDELAGQAFNIGGGPGNAISLLELIDLIDKLNGASPRLDFAAWRTGDQPYYVSDTSRFGAATGWRPRVDMRDGIARLHAWLNGIHPDARPRRRSRQAVTP
ncbi:MAG TPA: NAD-dependent epimerase/dehydratase family protein [Gammaproteobacteria bacterium]|nr:NAD-dependent epimerase/dehydratase family protein [Gammaproteobacteria bacterium]